jgi:hypothetical protein
MPKRGGSRGKKDKTSLHHLTREHLKASELQDYFNELNTANDRTCALVGGAALDQTLVRILAERFIPLDDTGLANTFYEPQAPLGSLSIRIQLCYLLGIIPLAVKDDLDRIRRIRNAFAHRVHALEFSHPLVQLACDGLGNFAEALPNPITPRERFISCALGLHIILAGVGRKWAVQQREKSFGELAAALSEQTGFSADSIRAEIEPAADENALWEKVAEIIQRSQA